MPFVSGGHVWLLLILLVIVLIIWGPGKLPDVGGALGRGIKEFRKASSETKDHFNAAMTDDVPAPTASSTLPPPPPTPPASPDPGSSPPGNP